MAQGRGSGLQWGAQTSPRPQFPHVHCRMGMDQQGLSEPREDTVQRSTQWAGNSAWSGLTGGQD